MSSPHISTRTAGDALFNFDLLLDGFTLEDLAEILPLVFEKVTLTAEGELELVRRDLSAADGSADGKKGGEVKAQPNTRRPPRASWTWCWCISHGGGARLCVVPLVNRPKACRVVGQTR